MRSVLVAVNVTVVLIVWAYLMISESYLMISEPNETDTTMGYSATKLLHTTEQGEHLGATPMKVTPKHLEHPMASLATTLTVESVRTVPTTVTYRTEAMATEVSETQTQDELSLFYIASVDDIEGEVSEVSELAPVFQFPVSVSEGARKYLEEAYNQAYEASKDTAFPDPFMALSLSVVEMPVSNSEVFRIPLVYQDTLDKALEQSGGDYSAAIQHSFNGRSYTKYACVGPLQIAPGWVACEQRNPTLWRESCQMFYEDAELAIPGLTEFAEKCDIPVTDTLLRTLAAMRHNVGHLSDWKHSDPNTRTGRYYIPFKSKKAVFKWNEAVASEKAQQAIKEAAYASYLDYLQTGIYENQGIKWQEIAAITGYSQSNITSTKEWWRPLYNVRFWYNYYLLRLLYGVDSAATLGLIK